jgi:hypothetical protein
METRHRRQIRGQGFAFSRFKLLEQKVYGLLDELLCGVVFLRGALLVRGLTAERRIFAVRRGGGGCVAAGVRHGVCSPLVPAWGEILKEGVCLKPNFFV